MSVAPQNLEIVPGGRCVKDGFDVTTWKVGSGAESGFFELRHGVPLEMSSMCPDSERADHPIVAVLLHAMSMGRDVNIRGVVSPALLRGLDELQAIWNRWRPERYSRVTLRVDREAPVDSNGNENGALFAFSGGVDARFSVLRHAYGEAGPYGVTPTAALLVHGMDIPLSNRADFQQVVSAAERRLGAIQIPLLTMFTNSRAMKQKWEDSFGAQLTACFLFLQREFGSAVLGSAEPYDALVLPWGSTPLTDRLASTDTLRVVHDGAEYDRTEKVDWLVKHSKDLSDLRVCWAGARKDRNCGTCEKCVRTMLNFWAMNNPLPSAFPAELTPNLVESLRVQPGPTLQEILSIRAHATRNHSVRDPVLRALNKVIRKSKVSYYRRSLTERLKRKANPR